MTLDDVAAAAQIVFFGTVFLACRTVLHDACWSEVGRCPVLGCIGSVPERSAVRTP